MLRRPRFGAMAALLALLFTVHCSDNPRSTQEPDEEAVRSYLLAHPDFLERHPEVLDAAREAHERAEIAKTQAIVRKVLATFDDLVERNVLIPRLGNLTGKTTIIEFADYLCLPCRASFPALETVRAQTPDLRLVVLPYPLFGMNSDIASRAAFAADRQGHFEMFHKALMTTEEYINRTFVLKLAESMLLDMERFRADMNDPRYEDLVAEVRRMADALGIEGPPAFIVGDKLLRGGVGLTTLSEAMLPDGGTVSSGSGE